MSTRYQIMVFDHEYWDRDSQALRQWLTESEISGVLILVTWKKRWRPISYRAGCRSWRWEHAIIACVCAPILRTTQRRPIRRCSICIPAAAAKWVLSGDPMYSTAFGERYDGFCSALRRFGLPCDPQHLLLTPRADDADIPLETDRPCTGSGGPVAGCVLLCERLSGASVRQRRCSCAGFRCPARFRWLVWTKTPSGKIALPSLTSIDVHCRQQAELSIRKLISFVCGEEYDPAALSGFPHRAGAGGFGEAGVK